MDLLTTFLELVALALFVAGVFLLTSTGGALIASAGGLVLFSFALTARKPAR